MILGAVAMVLALSTAPAMAHVDLASSAPGAGQLIQDPIEEITLVFTADATPAGDGILLYDQDSNVIPAEVEVVSGTEILIVPESELDGGRYAVAWTMKAGDSHPRSGVLEFAVAVSTETVPSTTTPVQPTEVIEPEQDRSVVVSVEPAEEATPAAAELGSTESQAESFAPIVSAARPQPAGEWLVRVARGVSMLAALVGIGALAFAYLVFEGSSREARKIGVWVRRAGVALIVSAPLEVAAQSMLLNGLGIDALTPGALMGAAGAGLGTATLFRLAGGAAMLGGTTLTTVLRMVPFEPSPGYPSSSTTTTTIRRSFRVVASPIAIAGSLATALSFMFDGHSATEDPRSVVQAASVAHVLAASVWVGGVVFLAATLIGRHRRGEPVAAARLVIPFSTVASVSVVFVGLAGSALALSIVDAPSHLFSTGWGLALLTKIALVAIAGSIGAYNHFVAVPALKLDETAHGVEDRLRRIIRIEAALLIGVAAVSAVLVGMSP